MAHNNFDILNTMLHLLDNDNNDIFIHLDKKIKRIKIWKGEKSSIIVLDKRFDIRWANESQIKLELYMFSEAFKHGPYVYYHLLSGVDMPLKNNNYIHDFFKANLGKEFVGFVPLSIMNKEVFKVINYHFFTNHLKDKTNKWTKIHWRLIELQMKYGISRKTRHEYRKGSNWVSITNEFVKYLIDRKKEIIKEYKFTFGCDEIFLQTELWNSPFRKNIYDINDEFHSSMRKIDWNRGCPYTWKENDFNELISSNAIFARKFDECHMDIVKKIANALDINNSSKIK
jgi:hypothetical protein